jgi:HEAT repeats
MSNEREVQIATGGRDRDATLPPAGSAPPASPRAQMMERDKVIMILLRQLSSGFSAYRLFPGDLKQPSFVQAVERIRDAAGKALAWGPVEAEINGSRFITEAGPSAPDERLDRLALTLYQHRAERIGLRTVPDGRELGVLYEALTKPVDGGSGSAGVGSALLVGGVKSMTVREVAVQGHDAEKELSLHTTGEQRALWDKLHDPDAFSRDIAAEVAGLSEMPEAAAAVYARLQRMVSSLPERLVRGFELYARLHQVLFRLPQALRRAVVAILLENVREDPVAEALIGTLSDADLARVLVDQGADDLVRPLQLAQWLVNLGIRREDLVELTAALQAGSVEGGTIFAGLERVGIVAPGGSGSTSMAQTVSNLLARGLVSVGQEDVRAIREAFPDTPAQERAVALLALSDYLRIETAQDRLGEVLGIWAEETASAIKAGNEELVTQLLQAVDGAQPRDAAQEKRDLVEASIRRVLTPELLADLISQTDEPGKLETAIRLLRPFGPTAVECLMEDLATERERGRRALLLGVLAEVARGHHQRVAAHLSDPRWFVARNAVTILYRTGGPESAPLLLQACRHREPAVRREAIRGLLVVSGLDSLQELSMLAGDSDASVRSALITALGGVTVPGAATALAKLVHVFREPADRRLAMEALSRHPSQEATDALAELASTKSKPRLPRRIRRHAASLLKARHGGSA